MPVHLNPLIYGFKSKDTRDYYIFLKLFWGQFYCAMLIYYQKNHNRPYLT